jgi:hypothetical protein
VRETLPLCELKPWRKDCWVIPLGEDAEFVAHRSEVLQLYTSINNPGYPLVCRIPDKDTLKTEVAAWREKRNETANTIDWRLTTQDARIKLKHLYPSISPIG